MNANDPVTAAKRVRAERDTRVLKALRVGGRPDVIATALGVSDDLVRRIAHEARKTGHPDAVPARKPWRKPK